MSDTQDTLIERLGPDAVVVWFGTQGAEWRYLNNRLASEMETATHYVPAIALADRDAKIAELERLYAMASHGEWLQQQENLRLCKVSEEQFARAKAADALATSADKDAEIARLTSERAALAEAAANFWTAVDRAEAAEAEAAALRERLERSSKQIEYALTKASLSAPEKISDALSLARALQNKEQANG